MLNISYNCTEEEWRGHRANYDGLCLACGEWTCGGCEPDARQYKCQGCGEHKVYGAEEALIMGALEFEGDD